MCARPHILTFQFPGPQPYACIHSSVNRYASRYSTMFTVRSLAGSAPPSFCFFFAGLLLSSAALSACAPAAARFFVAGSSPTGSAYFSVLAESSKWVALDLPFPFCSTSAALPFPLCPASTAFPFLPLPLDLAVAFPPPFPLPLSPA